MGKHRAEREEHWGKHRAEREENWGKHRAEREEHWGKHRAEWEEHWGKHRAEREDREIAGELCKMTRAARCAGPQDGVDPWTGTRKEPAEQAQWDLK